AGNVNKEGGDGSDSDGRNDASLITLITIGDEKAILCGDATLSTENYLRVTLGDDIKDPDLILIPHHGSDNSCSSNNFVNHVNPTRQVNVSVKRHEHGYALPRKNTIAKYEAKLNDNKDREHTTNYWGENEYKTPKETVAAAQGVVGLWEKSVTHGNVYNSSNWDEDAKTANEDSIAVKVNQKSLLILYRKPTTKTTRQTGLDGHQWTFFTGTRQ
ncbi:MAG: beta-lactamase domain-containing protein, partial [bacterium]